MAKTMRHTKLCIEYPKIVSDELSDLGLSERTALAAYINGIQRRLSELAYIVDCYERTRAVPHEIPNEYVVV